MSAFVSQKKDEFTLVGTSMVEGDTPVEINLKDFSPAVKDKKVFYYRTSGKENCARIGEVNLHDGRLTITVPERSIFTITTASE